MKLRDLFSKAINKNTKQVSFCLKKRIVYKKKINLKEVFDMELNDDDFLK